MRAVVHDRYGPPEVLRVEEVEDPEPGPGEVRVRVAVAGVNPTDVKARAGGPRGGGLAAGFQVPGQDGAGVVEAVGPGVDAARVGERVWVFFAAWRRPWGTAAQRCVVPADRAVPLPDGAGFDLGAHLGIPALTAHRCLHADGPIAGRTVLVTGGAGAVGHFAIELAVHGGARVVATVSSDEKAQLARAAGAGGPPPKVTSAVVHIVPAAAPDGVDTRVMGKLTEAAFGQRRKMLRSSLKSLPGAAEAAEALGIDLRRRAETLAVEEYVKLARALSGT